jgi:hypothetical protein
MNECAWNVHGALGICIGLYNFDVLCSLELALDELMAQEPLDMTVPEPSSLPKYDGSAWETAPLSERPQHLLVCFFWMLHLFI